MTSRKVRLTPSSVKFLSSGSSLSAGISAAIPPTVCRIYSYYNRMSLISYKRLPCHYEAPPADPYLGDPIYYCLANSDGSLGLLDPGPPNGQPASLPPPFPFGSGLPLPAPSIAFYRDTTRLRISWMPSVSWVGWPSAPFVAISCSCMRSLITGHSSMIFSWTEMRNTWTCVYI